ncbi:MAG: cell division protein FtsA [Myxococcales bacterium]|nr:cell division protein FtsA [Myxococcales bacterium]
MARRDEIIVGLDVGTTKVAAVVGEVREDGSVDVIGVGMTASHGIKKGVVVHADETTEAIRRAVHEAELMAGCTVAAVYIGVSGGHLKSFNNRGVVAVANGEVSHEDVERVIENARAVQIPADRQIVHTVPQEFLVDDNDGIKHPVGINGTRLQVNVHIITALNSGVQNVSQCAERAGLHVLKVHSELLSSALAVLEEDEKELGVVMVDIGGGTTDIAVFHNGAIVHSAVLPVGGDHITNDIAVGLRTPRKEAERIKLKHGCALSQMVEEDENIEVACVGGREPVERRRTLLCDIIEPRMEEIFRLVEGEVQASNFADVLGSGVVVTGGTALLPGIAELGEDVLNLPVRIGKPRPVGGLYDLVKASTYSTAVGLVHQGAIEDAESARRQAIAAAGEGGSGWVGRFRDWIREAFA